VELSVLLRCDQLQILDPVVLFVSVYVVQVLTMGDLSAVFYPYFAMLQLIV